MADFPTTRHPNGVTNAAYNQTMADAGLPDPSWAHVYHNDFDTYAAGDWTITNTGAATAALQAGDGGQLLITTTTGAADASYFQLKAAGFKIAAGKEMFFKFSGILSDVTNSVFHCGLLNTTTTPQAETDGVFIRKPTGSGALQLVVAVGSSETVLALPSACVLVAATQFELGLHIDYLGNVEAYWNPGTGPQFQTLGVTSNASSGVPVASGAVAKLAAPSLPTANLNVSFGLLNSTGAARTLAVDYVTAVKHR